MAVTWRDAVQEAEGGVRLLVEVTAGAKENKFPDGFNAWREGRIGVRVRAPAQDGKANQEVLATVGKVFGAGPAGVQLAAGATDARKSLMLVGVSRAKAIELLERAFAAR